MRFLLPVLVCVLAWPALADPRPTRPVPPRAKHSKERHRWKCTTINRITFCEIVDRPLASAGWEQDAVKLLSRAAPEFEPLVAAPRSFRD